MTKPYWTSVKAHFETMTPVNDDHSHIRRPGRVEATYHGELVDQIIGEGDGRYRVYIRGVKYGYLLPGHGVLRVVSE